MTVESRPPVGDDMFLIENEILLFGNNMFLIRNQCWVANSCGGVGCLVFSRIDRVANTKRVATSSVRWMSSLHTTKGLQKDRFERFCLTDITIVANNASPYGTGLSVDLKLNEVFQACKHSLQVGAHLLRDDTFFAIEAQ